MAAPSGAGVRTCWEAVLAELAVHSEHGQWRLEDCLQLVVLQQPPVQASSDLRASEKPSYHSAGCLRRGLTSMIFRLSCSSQGQASDASLCASCKRAAHLGVLQVVRPDVLPQLLDHLQHLCAHRQQGTSCSSWKQLDLPCCGAGCLAAAGLPGALRAGRLRSHHSFSAALRAAWCPHPPCSGRL